MIIEAIICFFGFGACHEWRERPLLNNPGKAAGFSSRTLGEVKSDWRHDQGFYPDGTNIGYFNDGVHEDNKEKSKQV